MFRCVGVLVSAALCLSLGGCSNELSGTATIAGKSRNPTLNRTSSEASVQLGSDQARATTITALSGEENSTYSRTMADLAEVLDRHRFRLRPIASKGPRQDLLNLLHHPEIDIAIVQTDALEALDDRERALARERLRYLFRVPDKELHVLAPRNVTGIRELDGRKVNIDRPGSDTHLTARLMFEELGIDPEFTTYDQETAQERLKSGEIQAAVLLASRPSGQILAFPSYGRFHLLPISFEQEGLNYHPGRFTADDYPHLVETGQQVDTMAVGRVLAVRNWAEGSPRSRRLLRLAEALYGRFDELQKPGHHPGWRDVDLVASVPGWQRFQSLQAFLDQRIQHTGEQRAFERYAVASGMCSLPASRSARERIYRDFLEWRRAQAEFASPAGSGPSQQ